MTLKTLPHPSRRTCNVTHVSHTTLNCRLLELPYKNLTVCESVSDIKITKITRNFKTQFCQLP